MKSYFNRGNKLNAYQQTKSFAPTSPTNHYNAKMLTNQMKYYRDHHQVGPKVIPHLKSGPLTTVYAGLFIVNFVAIVSSGALPASNNPLTAGTGSTGPSYGPGGNVTNSTDLAYSGMGTNGVLPTTNNTSMASIWSTGSSYVAGNNVTNSTNLAYSINNTNSHNTSKWERKKAGRLSKNKSFISKDKSSNSPSKDNSSKLLPQESLKEKAISLAQDDNKNIVDEDILENNPKHVDQSPITSSVSSPVEEKVDSLFTVEPTLPTTESTAIANVEVGERVKRYVQGGGVECGEYNGLKLICDNNMTPDQIVLVKQTLPMTGDIYKSEYGPGKQTLTCKVGINPMVQNGNYGGYTGYDCKISNGHAINCVITLAYVDKNPINIMVTGHEIAHGYTIANGRCGMSEEDREVEALFVERKIEELLKSGQYASGGGGGYPQASSTNSYNRHPQDQSQHQYQRGGTPCGEKNKVKLFCHNMSADQSEIVKQVFPIAVDVYNQYYARDKERALTCDVILNSNYPDYGQTFAKDCVGGYPKICTVYFKYVDKSPFNIETVGHESFHVLDFANGHCALTEEELDARADPVEKEIQQSWNKQYASGRAGSNSQSPGANSYNTQNQDQSQHQYQRGGTPCGKKHNLELLCDHTVSPSQRELMKQVLDLTGDVYSSQYSVGNPITCSVTIDPTLIYIDRLGDMLPYYGPNGGHPNACRIRLASFSGNIRDIAVASHEKTHAYDAGNGREATEQNANWVAGRVKKLWQSGQYLNGRGGGYSQDSGANVYNTQNQGQSQHQSNQPPCPNQQYQSNQPPCQKQQHQSNTKSPSQHQSPNGGNTEVILLLNPDLNKYEEYACTQGTVKLDPPVLNVDFNIIRGNPHCSASNIGAHRLPNRKINIDKDIIIVKSKEGSEDKASVIKYDFQNDLLSMFLESDLGSIIQYMCNILHAKYWPHCPLGNFYYSITNRTPAAVKLAANEFLVKVIKQYCNNQGEVQSSGHRPAAPSTNKPYDYNPVSTQQAGHDPRTGGEIELDPEVEGDIELEDLPPEHTPSTQRSPSETQTAGPVRKVENNAMIYVQTQALNKNPDKPIFSPSVATVSQEYLIYEIKTIQIKVNLDNSSDTTHYLCPKKLSEYYSDTFIAELPPITEEVFKEYISSCSVVQHMGRILPKGSVDNLEKLPDPQKLVQLPPPQLMRNFAEGFIGTDSSNKSSISIELKVAIGVGVGGALLTGAGFAWCIMTCYKKIHPKPPAPGYPSPEDGQHGGNQRSDHVKRSTKSEHTIIKLEENSESESEDEDDSVHTTHAAPIHHPVISTPPVKKALIPKSSQPPKFPLAGMKQVQHPHTDTELADQPPPPPPPKDYKPYKPVNHSDDYPEAHFSSVLTKDDYTDYYDVEVLAKYHHHSTEL